MNDAVMQTLLTFQKNEVTESIIYHRIATFTRDEKNAAILRRIADEELAHARRWQTYTRRDIAPSTFAIFWYPMLARIFGFTFAVKVMESGEEQAQLSYADIAADVPEATTIAADEQRHEAELLNMLDEERLQYVGAMVLGLNDALIELTGTLAGMTFALADTRLVALAALITGSAATLSMASSQFLSARAEGRSDALKSCCYCGAAYLFAVGMLALPYLVLPASACYWALAWMLVHVIAIIAAFNYYISVTKGGSFKARFGEMASISMGVAVLSFGIGLLVKKCLGL